MVVAEPETCKAAAFIDQHHLQWPDPVSTEVGYSPEGLGDLLLSIVGDKKREGSVGSVCLPSLICPQTGRTNVPGVLWEPCPF